MRSRGAFVRAGTIALTVLALAPSSSGCAARRAEVRHAFALAHSSHRRELLAVHREDFSDPKDPGRAKTTTAGSTFVRDLALMSKTARKTFVTRGVPDFLSWDKEGSLTFVYDLYYPDENVVMRLHRRPSRDDEEEFPIPEGDKLLIEKSLGKPGPAPVGQIAPAEEAPP